MTLPPSAPALCSSCRFPLDEYKAGQRHYGTHTAHAEWYCIQRLCNEVDRLRAYAERYLVLVAYLTRHQLLRAEFCQPEAGMKAGDYWVLRSPAIIDGSSCLGYGKSEDAAIDAAMKAPT